MMTFVKILLVFLSLILSQIAIAKQHIILVMGDSLSAGYGIDIQSGWVNLLAQEYTKNNIAKITNASVSGETSSGGLARLPALLSTHKPNIVILELGGNDGLRGQPLNLLEQNLQAMITASKAAGATVLLVGMQIPTNYGQRYTTQFKNIYVSLAEKNNIPLVPFLLENVAMHSELIQNDGIHPTTEAQPIIVRNIKPLLDSLLK